MASWLWHEWQRDPQAARITLMALVLGAVMALEALLPRRTARRRQRWFVNGALVVIAGLVLSLLPIAAIGLSSWAQQHGNGLFQSVVVTAITPYFLFRVALYGEMSLDRR